MDEQIQKTLGELQHEIDGIRNKPVIDNPSFDPETLNIINKKLDLTEGLAQGDVFFVDENSEMKRLPPGTSGQFLKTQGAAADPTWASLPFKFGGNGSDGALAVSSGTTTIDLAGAAYVVKNYTSISITGTGKIAFSNPHAEGTIVIFKSQGNVTITSSQPGIDASGIGAAGGAAGAALSDGATGGTGRQILDTSAHGGVKGIGVSGGAPGTGGAGGAGGSAMSVTAGIFYTISAATLSATKSIKLFTGSGGGGGGGGTGTVAGGAGGAGGGCLIIECAGALNFTGTISVAGIAGVSGVSGTANNGGGGGGGGGSAGTCLILYETLTASSGSVTIIGGAGGGGGNGGNDGTAGAGGGGGGGAGSTGGAGGAAGNGGNAGSNGSNGSAGAGVGAAGGGGGGAGSIVAIGGVGGSGGAAGSANSSYAIVAKNNDF